MHTIPVEGLPGAGEVGARPGWLRTRDGSLIIPAALESSRNALVTPCDTSPGLIGCDPREGIGVVDPMEAVGTPTLIFMAWT